MSDGRTVLAQQSYKISVGTPDDVFYGRAVYFRNGLLLLNVIKDNRGSRAEDEACGASVEDLVGLDWRLDALHD